MKVEDINKIDSDVDEFLNFRKNSPGRSGLNLIMWLN